MSLQTPLTTVEELQKKIIKLFKKASVDLRSGMWTCVRCDGQPWVSREPRVMNLRRPPLTNRHAIHTLFNRGVLERLTTVGTPPGPHFIVGKTETYKRNILIRALFGTQTFWVPDPFPPPPLL